MGNQGILLSISYCNNYLTVSAQWTHAAIKSYSSYEVALDSLLDLGSLAKKSNSLANIVGWPGQAKHLCEKFAESAQCELLQWREKVRCILKLIQ